MNKCCFVALLLFATLSGCTPSRPPEVATPSSSEIEEVVLSQEEAISRATAGFKGFGDELKTELQQALGDGGPVNAVEVCQKIAPELAIEHSNELGFEIGRSSHKVRNSSNAPSDTVARYLKTYADAGEKAPVEAYSDGRQWTVIAPIITQPLCLNCHGDSKTFSSELTEALSYAYPDDKATGFEVGDVRGVFWAHLP